MRGKISNLVLGLVFIGLGLGIAGDVMNLWEFRVFSFPGWWTMFIIIPCLIGIIRDGFNGGAAIGLVIGLMLFIGHYVDFNVWNLILPAILIIIGLQILFRGLGGKKIPVDKTIHVEGQAGHRTNRKEYSAIFAGNKIRISDHFIGASLNAVFGGLTIDLRDAVIDSDVEISATAVFGGIDIYLPQEVQVRVNNIPIFGGVSNKRLYTSEPNGPTIYLNSTTMFGGIDLK